MGRIIAQAEITNPADESKSMQCSMFVDTGAAFREQAQAAVDMLGHRLIPVKHIDCK